MVFLGRETEIARIEAALNDGRNVVLQGKYGIGRTALVREVDRRNSSWRFVFSDFGATGTAISASIMADLSGRSRHAVCQDTASRKLARAVASYTPPKRIKRVVVVLDNVAKVTRPKIELLRRFRTSQQIFFIAILERFIQGEDVMRMRAVLDPAVIVVIEALDLQTSVRFFASAAAQFQLPWTTEQVELLARTMHGYPLEMTRMVEAARRRRGGVGR